MAKQEGMVKITGTVGDVTYYKTRDGGYGARMKSSLSRERVMKDDCFALTRKNNEEFGRAAKCGKLVRSAFAGVLGGADSKMYVRLQSVMTQCLKTDKESTYGDRCVAKGDLSLLEGFDFNVDSPMSRLVLVPLSCSVDRVTGTVEVVVPPFVPRTGLKCRKQATHYRLVLAGAELDFEAGDFYGDVSRTGYLPINGLEAAAVSLSVSVTANSVLPIVVVYGVEFFVEVNGKVEVVGGGGVGVLGVSSRD